MRIGKLRHRITLQDRVRTPDGYGGYSLSWSDADSVWADISVTGSREAAIAGSITGTPRFSFRIRKGVSVNTDMRVKYRGQYLNIRSVAGTLNDPRYIDFVAELDTPT